MISKQIIPLIKIYNSIFDYRLCEINEQLYNYIDMDNIWFNSDYNIILYPGKLTKSKKSVNNITNDGKNNLHQFLIKLFKLSNQSDIILKEKTEENANIQLNIDLMNFGITLMNINIYFLDITVNDLFELIQNNNFDNNNNVENGVTDNNNNEINNNENNVDNNYCCLFHYFYKNVKIFSNFYDCLRHGNEFKENYFDFLHNLTSFKINENNFEKIINHSFINNSSVIINTNSNINELIKIGKVYDFSNEYYTSNSNIISFDLISDKIRKNLKNFMFFYDYYNINDTKTLYNMYNIEIEELCKELKVNVEELHEKLIVNYENLLDNNNQN